MEEGEEEGEEGEEEGEGEGIEFNMEEVMAAGAQEQAVAAGTQDEVSPCSIACTL